MSGTTCEFGDAKWRTVFDRAQARANRTEAPRRFMNEFEDTLRTLRKNGSSGENELMDRRKDAWPDTLSLAAEVEALSAFRALEHWGTGWGLCPFSVSLQQHYQYRKHRLVA
jgi:hypothetical protein